MADHTADILIHLDTVEEAVKYLRQGLGASRNPVTNVSNFHIEVLDTMRRQWDEAQDSAAAIYDFITEEEIAARGKE